MKIFSTIDGSDTIFSEEFNEVYHSRNGAIQESQHVFIKNGFSFFSKDNIKIFEVGFGTGLNALLTMLESESKSISVVYTTVELFPLDIETIKSLNYTTRLGYEFCYGPYHTLHLCRWNETHQINNLFSFRKLKTSLLDCSITDGYFDMVYFDAFAPENQPEMWTPDVFLKLYNALTAGGVLVTYCSKSSVQKTLKSVGFVIEKLKGPAGKREMLRARKE